MGSVFFDTPCIYIMDFQIQWYRYFLTKSVLNLTLAISVPQKMQSSICNVYKQVIERWSALVQFSIYTNDYSLISTFRKRTRV